MSSYITRKTPGNTEWFRHDRFGMFIHWGLYSQMGQGEWIQNRRSIPVEEYEKLQQEQEPTEPGEPSLPDIIDQLFQVVLSKFV